jgi:membrane protease YdiL (CAAX protease family)
MKSKFWTITVGCAFISLIVLWIVIERIFYSLPPSRVRVLGYQVAGILAFVGIAGIAIGIKILKKRQLLAAGLIGFFLSPVVVAILTFIFGP